MGAAAETSESYHLVPASEIVNFHFQSRSQFMVNCGLKAFFSASLVQLHNHHFLHKDMKT